jgi:hypothetical protein
MLLFYERNFMILCLYISVKSLAVRFRSELWVRVAAICPRQIIKCLNVYGLLISVVNNTTFINRGGEIENTLMNLRYSARRAKSQD